MVCEISVMIVSIDTVKSEVARAVLNEGAAIVNDVSGLQQQHAPG